MPIVIGSKDEDGCQKFKDKTSVTQATPPYKGKLQPIVAASTARYRPLLIKKWHGSMDQNLR